MYAFRLAVCSTALFILCAGTPPLSLAGAGNRPNIVVIMSDDAGYADFGFQNQFTGETTILQTPNLDQLASQGVAFSNSYIIASQCAISRAGLMTGRQPDAFGYSWNALDDDRPYEGLPLSQTTLLQEAKQAGYATGIVGKWHLGQDPGYRPQDRGADYFFGMWEAGINYFRNDASPTKIRRGETPVEWWNESSFNNIANDPTRGRYLTDAFADEASKFISEQAGGSEPFFLYTALNAPHAPYEAKSQDYAAFPTLSGQRRQVAGMTLGMDRAIGHILDRIDDPNGDGNTSDSIADDTIVVFLNDNGGANAFYDNGPLAGLKGQGWEGGLRVPMLIRAPGVAPGVFSQPVTSLDLFPTLMNAMGEAITTPHDGADLMPHLLGQQTGPVHESIVFRNRVNYAAIRKGEWKLTKPDAGSTWKLFKLNPDGSGEDVDRIAENAELVQELIKEYVAVDVTLDKARNSGPAKVHFNDLFIRRNEAGNTSFWSNSSGWWNGDAPTETASISRDDPSPNMVLSFTPNNAADYRSVNDINRASGISRTLLSQGFQDLPGIGEVMLSEMRLEGAYAGAANRKATIEGKPLMFVKNLSGGSPTLRLDAMQSAGQFNYTYNVDLNMYLYHDFVIEGNGNANFRINGAMSSFDPPSGVTKRGTSTVTFTGHNTFTGAAVVQGGTVIVEGANAAVDGASRVTVNTGATLSLKSGLINTQRLEVSPSSFQFLGGTLKAAQVVGNLTNSGGTLSIDESQQSMTLVGDYAQQPNGRLLADLDGYGPGSNPLMLLSGSAHLAGALELDLQDLASVPIGSSVTILTAMQGVSGLFDNTTLPAGSFWSVLYSPFTVSVRREASATTGPIFFADFDADGDVDGNDLLVWQRNVGGSGPAGDVNRDGVVNGADLVIWQSQVGATPHAAALDTVTAVPEPSGWLLAAAGMLAGPAAARKRLRCRFAT